MQARPITLKEANRMVARLHRHARPTRGGLFAIGVERRGELVGAAIVGRPVAQKLQDGRTAEITRVCTDGTLHACSVLYGKCVRVLRELGYWRVVTYTLASESGASLRAAGFVPIASVVPDTWERPNRVRAQTEKTLFGDVEKRDAGPKTRWERLINQRGPKHGDPVDRVEPAGEEADVPLPRR